MSNTEQEEPLDAHTALYNEWRGTLENRVMLHEYASDALLSDLKKLAGLRHNATALGDALTCACTALGRPPLDTLLVVHEVMRMYVSILQHGGADDD